MSTIADEINELADQAQLDSDVEENQKKHAASKFSWFGKIGSIDELKERRT